MASDLNQGALKALGPAPKPPIEPYIPLGTEGTLRNNRVICIGFTIRGCTVEGERYRWREYLIYAGPRVGYLWLMEEDGVWWLVTPIPPGEVAVSGGSALYKTNYYNWKQSVKAETEYVIGEFYWKVEIGETVHVPGFGVFYPKRSKARRIRDLKTGVLITLGVTGRVGLRASKHAKWSEPS